MGVKKPAAVEIEPPEKEVASKKPPDQNPPGPKSSIIKVQKTKWHCPDCDMYFPSQINMNAHFMTKHKTKKLSQPIARDTAPSEGESDSEVESISDVGSSSEEEESESEPEPEWSCEKCKEEFVSKIDFDAHNAKYHDLKKIGHGVSEEGEEEFQHFCIKCNLNFESSIELNAHNFKIHETGKKYELLKQLRSGSNPSKAVAPSSSQPVVAKPSTSSQDPIAAEEEDSSHEVDPLNMPPSKASMLSNPLLHESVRNFTRAEVLDAKYNCKECNGRPFSTLRAFQAHNAVFHTPNPFCPICNIKPQNMAKHMEMMHKNVVKCDFCPAQVYDLDKHLMVAHNMHGTLNGFLPLPPFDMMEPTDKTFEDILSPFMEGQVKEEPQDEED